MKFNNNNFKSITTVEKQKFNEGENVILVFTGEVKKIRKVVRAAWYWAYSLEGEDGYRISTDLRKIKK